MPVSKYSKQQQQQQQHRDLPKKLKAKWQDFLIMTRTEEIPMIFKKARSHRIKQQTATPVDADLALNEKVDESGQRIVTLETVQHDIWLTGGRIPMTRLIMKIFDIKRKSSKNRKTHFKDVVRELCFIAKAELCQIA
jgi:hypothetical protein